MRNRPGTAASKIPRLTRAKVVKLAQQFLEPHQSKEFRLEVVDAERQSDGWWYVIFRPSVPKLKSYEYEGRVVAAMMDMQEQGIKVVFLEESLADVY